MFLLFSESFINFPTLIWAGFSLLAAGLLFTAANRRQSQLIESLKSFVDRAKPTSNPIDEQVSNETKE